MGLYYNPASGRFEDNGDGNMGGLGGSPQGPAAAPAPAAAPLTPEQIKAQSDSEIAKQQAQTAEDQARGFDKDGKPVAPAWQGITNADGTLKDQFNMKDWQNVTADTSALDMMKTDAERTPGTLSQAGQAQLSALQQAQQGNLDQYGQTAAAKNTQMQDAMASQGGLSPAARERMAKMSMMDQLTGQQGIRQSGMNAEAGLRSQDAQEQQTALQNVQAGMNTQSNLAFQNQQQQQNVNQTNLGHQIDQVTQQRAWDANKYNQAMSAWGASKSADAQAAAARSSGGGKK